MQANDERNNMTGKQAGTMGGMASEEPVRPDSIAATGPVAGAGQPNLGGPPLIDQVTGAFSMPGFNRIYAETIGNGPVEDMALWYIDIRNFRLVNPKCGFLAGNYILKCVVDVIRERMTLGLPICRLGADRFIFITGGLGFEESKKRFNEAVAQINETVAAEGIVSYIDLVGGLYYLQEEDFADDGFKRALDYASIAHRNSKEESTPSIVLFTEEDLERDLRRITIEQSIDAALKDGQISVWYQPQIDYIFGEVVGAEALARWKHPDLGWIAPDEFIPILENCGKIHDLDLFVWEEACRSASKWRIESDGKPVPISVNVSRVEMFEENLVDHFVTLRKKYDLPKGSLHLEVTESAFSEESGRIYDVVDRLKNSDLSVEMDDFGNGLSSLSMLKDVSVDVVKLDMGFIRSSMGADRGAIVLASVIRMLQGLDTPIIAEGVETLEQAEMLKNMGCRLMQGYHFSKPMPLEEFEAFIACNNTFEQAKVRAQMNSNLEDLLSFDSTTSYLFNNAVGGIVLFFQNGELVESLLVNDAFYEACGLERDAFGDSKINPLTEIHEDSRETILRATAEAKESGSALCTAQVRLSGRWIECVIRFITSSARGDVYSLNVIKSFETDERAALQALRYQNLSWDMRMMEKVLPSGFVKCVLDEIVSVQFITPAFVEHLGFNREEFLRRYHNSFVEFVGMADRHRLTATLRSAAQNREPFELKITVKDSFGQEHVARMLGRVSEDVSGQECVYAILMIGETNSLGSANEAADAGSAFVRVIHFDYYLAEDRLVFHSSDGTGAEHNLEFENWLEDFEEKPEIITTSSAAKVLATVRDLRHHPVSGFTDLKCNLLGGKGLSWYHVNYSCESDEEGNTTIIHGFAQDADDLIGSTKWWRNQAERDYLTGLLNRNTIAQSINTAMRTYGAGMMFMIDLDNFKRVNDELGHMTGDALLRDISEALSLHFRERDLLGRYGGDEFIAFMPVASGNLEDLARRRANEIFAELENVSISDGSHAECSIGVSIARSRDKTFYDMLEVADKALYISKGAGKGTCTILETDDS